MLIDAQKLKNVLIALLRNSGSDLSEAEIVADHPVRANLTGHDSHGAGVIPALCWLPETRSAKSLRNGWRTAMP